MGATCLLPEVILKFWLLKAAASLPAILARAVIAAYFGTCQFSSLMSEERFSSLPLQRVSGVCSPVVQALSFDNSDWSQFNGLLADASIMAGVHHICHVLVGLRSLFHNQFG